MTATADKDAKVALVIDDEPQIRRLLRITLESAGYRVFDAANGRDGIAQAAQRRPDVVLLDLALPDMDGIEVLLHLREWSHVPVVVLSVRDREDDKIAALDAGADDYVTKPFGAGELLARIRTVLRHVQATPGDAVFRCDDLEVDLAARSVRKGGRDVKLTPIEYSLLRMLVTHAGKIVTHRQLLTEVWGPHAVEQTHYLRVHIAHLREKLDEHAAEAALITTEPGIGYRMRAPA